MARFALLRRIINILFDVWHRMFLSKILKKKSGSTKFNAQHLDEYARHSELLTAKLHSGIA